METRARIMHTRKMRGQVCRNCDVRTMKGRRNSSLLNMDNLILSSVNLKIYAVREHVYNKRKERAQKLRQSEGLRPSLTGTRIHDGFLNTKNSHPCSSKCSETIKRIKSYKPPTEGVSLVRPPGAAQAIHTNK